MTGGIPKSTTRLQMLMMGTYQGSSVCTISNETPPAGGSDNPNPSRKTQVVWPPAQPTPKPTSDSTLTASVLTRQMTPPRTRTQQLVYNYIAGCLEGFDHTFSDEEIDTMAARFNALHQRLRGMAVVMGRDASIRLVFKPSLPSAAMKLDKPRAFHIGPNYLLNYSEEQLLCTALHEGSHADIDRVGSKAFFQNKMLNALYGTMVDVRANARVIDRAPGWAEDFHDDRARRYHMAYASLEHKMVGTLLPHEAFLQGILSREYGTDSPWDEDPVVGPALDEAWPHVERARDLRPQEADPTEEVIMDYLTKFEAVIMDDIYPIYKRLFDQALQQLEDMLDQLGDQQGDQQPQGAPQQGGGTPQAGDQDATGPMQQIIDDRLGQIIDIHQPQGSLGDKIDQARTVILSGAPQDAGDPDQADGAQVEGNGAVDEDDGSPAKPQPEPPPSSKPVKPQQPPEPKTPAVIPWSAAQAMQAVQDQQAKFDQYLADNAYARYLMPLGSLPDRVFQVFVRELKPNDAADYEGFYPSGPRPDVVRAVKAIHGMLTSLDVFLRLTEMTIHDYLFALAVDGSGSMNDEDDHDFGWPSDPRHAVFFPGLALDKDGALVTPQRGVKTRGALGMAALFVDVFERLETPYSLSAYHTSFIPLKGFNERLPTAVERNTLFNEIRHKHWNGHSTNIRDAIEGELNRIREARSGGDNEVAFIFVLTDGKENVETNPKTIPELCAEAAKENIVVVGIGIGQGMDTVRKLFPIHLVEEDPENLPYLFADFLREYNQKLKDLG